MRVALMDRMLCLAVFVAAVEEGSIAAAARRHGLSAVMAGRYLSGLEAGLAARLVQRTTRRLSLTDAGHAYFVRSKRILEEFEEANSEAADTHATPRGTLRIAAPITFGAMYMGQIVADFMAEFPGVSVEIQLQDRLVDLVEEGLDLAVRIGHLPDSDLVARALARCSMVSCASPTYLKRQGLPRTPAELTHHSRIGYLGTVSTPPWMFVAPSGATTTLDEPCRFSANNTSMMLEVALRGFGIVYGPSFVFAKHLETGELVHTLADFESPYLPLHAITPTAKHVSQKARLFIERLTLAFGESPPWERWRHKAAPRSGRKKDKGRRR
jgi:DNA-binding transcriptional LysR family regulator